jgi:hypothetical protein
MSWSLFRRTGLSEMRPYVPGEDLSQVSVSKEDTPELGGMIARNPRNHADQWYVSKKYFEENLESADSEKSLTVTSVSDAQAGKVSDIVVVGNGDMFRLLCKASSKSQGWMKSCKAMQTPMGCVVQVTTQQGTNVAEALTFVPGAVIVDDINGGRKLSNVQ